MQRGLEELLDLLWETLVGIASSCKNRVSSASQALYNLFQAKMHWSTFKSKNSFWLKG